MLLNNYHRMQFLGIAHYYNGCTITGLNNTITLSSISSNFKIKATDGTSLAQSFAGTATNGRVLHIGAMLGLYARPFSGMAAQTSFNTNSSSFAPYSNIIVGNGTTPATADDYAIESEIIDGLSCASVGMTMNPTNGTITYTKTMSNISDDTITISEIGYAAPIAADIGSHYMVLVAREVLDTPMQIAPGETFTVSFSFDVF